MNIISRQTAANDVDPFSRSDRDFNTGAGKGDRDRSVLSRFKRNFPSSMGPKTSCPGKRTFRYPSR